MNKRQTRSKATPNGMTPGVPPGEYRVSDSELARVRCDVHKLLADCPPEIGQAVHTYLDNATGQDATLLHWWAQCGHKDFARVQRVHVSAAARSTMSALGYACLVAYARGYLDEMETRNAGLNAAER